MKLKLAALFAIAGLLSPTPQLLAHHAFSAEYDANKTIVVKGVVTKLEWTNPHVRFYVDTKDEKGAVTNWDFELNSVNTLTRNGWTRHSLKVGDQITVTAYLAKDGSKRGNARGSVVLPDGRKLFAGEAQQGGASEER